MADTYRYVTPAPSVTAAFMDGSGFDKNGNPVAAPTQTPPTPTPAAAPTPTGQSYVGMDGKTYYQLSDGSNTSTPPPAPSSLNPSGDPIASYYQNLADPAVADQPIKDQIQKNMQAALDAIDQRYVSIYAQNDTNSANNLGQARSLAAASGTLGSSFGDQELGSAQATNTKNTQAIDSAKGAEQSAATLAAQGQLTTLASNEVAARKADALGQAQAAQDAFNQNKQQAMSLITQLSNSGATLTDAQKALLLRNSGLDEATFDSLYNSGLPANQKATITYHTVKNADGSEALLQITTKPDGTTSTKQMDGYNTGGQVVKEYGGRPYVQTTDAQGNIVLKPVSGYVAPSSDAQTLKAQTTAAVQKLGTYLTGLTGSDGYVSPESYKTARNAWVSDGNSASDFDNDFSGFVNPANAQDYGVKWKVPPKGIISQKNNGDGTSTVYYTDGTQQTIKN